MAGVWLRARAELGARWKAWLSLTLMLGLFGGSVIAIAAGARRTDTVYPRFLQWSRAWDVAVPHFRSSKGSSDNVFATVSLARVEALPHVASATRIEIYDTRGAISVNAPLDSEGYRSSTRAKVVEGRLPGLNAPNEVALNWIRAQTLGIHVGETIHIRFPLFKPVGAHRYDDISFRVVGTEASAGGFPPFLTDTP